MEEWILLTIVTAFLGAVRSAIRKHLTTGYGTLELSFMTNAYETVFLIPVALWQAAAVMHLDSLSPVVLGVATLSGLFGALTSIAGYRAFALEDLSVVKPLIHLNPVIVALVEPAVFAGVLHYQIFVGATLAGLGAYVILLDNQGILDPLRKFTDRGPKFAVLAAVAAAGSVLTTRYAALHLPEYIFAAYWAGVIVVAMVAPMVYYESFPEWRSFRDVGVMTTGMLGAIRGVLYVVILSIASATRVSIVLQTNILFSILLGGIVFQEKHLWKRFLGAMMIIGGVTVVLSQ
jgi:uncharacterized membrane protein